MGTDSGEKLRRLTGLEDIVLCAQTEALFQAGAILFAGDEKDGCVLTSGIFSYLPAYGQPIHFRHADIQQDQIGDFPVQQAERLPPAVCHTYLIAVSCKQRTGHMDKFRIVINDQNYGRMFHSSTLLAYFALQ